MIFWSSTFLDADATWIWKRICYTKMIDLDLKLIDQYLESAPLGYRWTEWRLRKSSSYEHNVCHHRQSWSATWDTALVARGGVETSAKLRAASLILIIARESHLTCGNRSYWEASKSIPKWVESAQQSVIYGVSKLLKTFLIGLFLSSYVNGVQWRSTWPLLEKAARTSKFRFFRSAGGKKTQ